MKRFLLFFGDRYYPSGGAADFLDHFDSKEEAIEAGIKKLDLYTWCNILDLETGEVAASFDIFEKKVDFDEKILNDYTRAKRKLYLVSKA